MSAKIEVEYKRSQFRSELLAVFKYVVIEDIPLTEMEEVMATMGHHAYQYWITPQGYDTLKMYRATMYDDPVLKRSLNSIIAHIDEERSMKLTNVVSLVEWKSHRGLL